MRYGRIVSVVAGVFWSVNLSGQTPTGTIQGVVSDSTGAVVPEARVVIANVKTNEIKELQTGPTGRYVQPFLLPGTYTIRVHKEGFRSVVQENIELNVGQNRTVDVTLELGPVTEQVQVAAAPPALDVNTSSVGQLIDLKRIMDLPLNGRDMLLLANLAPGVNPTGGGSSPTNPTGVHTPGMGGGRNSNSELQIDGVTDIAPENNPGVDLRIYDPQLDAVQEFTVQVNALAAEYGRFAGGLINLVTKSGTNTLRGTAYDYVRNAKLDANNFFANRAGLPKGTFKRNQFGFTAGGPILAPGLYNGRDRTFFFVGFEASLARTQDVFTGTVPPDEWRAGDFSSLRTSAGAPITIYDPVTVRQDPGNPGKYIRSPFPGNRIPAVRFDPVANTLLKYYPQANTAPANPYTYTNNFVSTGAPVQDSYRIDTRVDHNWTRHWRMFARVSGRWATVAAVNHFRNIATPSGAGRGRLRERHISLDHTYTLSPTLIGSLRYGFGRRYWPYIPFSDGIDLTSLGFPKYVDQAAYVKEFPRFDFSGTVSSLGQPSSTRQIIVPSVHSLNSSMTKIVPGHTIKFGMEYRKLLYNIAQYGSPSGAYAFSSAWTQQEIATVSGTAGFPFASFLLGLPSSGSMSHDMNPASASSYFAGYVQDDWKLASKLTLNIGLRYDVDRPRTERFNRYSFFRPYEPSPIAGKVAPSACPACGNLMGAWHFVDERNRRQAQTDKNNFGPRFGFAFKLSGNSVIRAGYGIVYPSSAFQAAGKSAGVGGYQSSTAMVSTRDSMRTIYASLRDPFPAGFNFPPGRADGALTNLGLGVTAVFDHLYKNPYVQQWNITVQSALPGELVVELGYLGNHGIGLVDGEGSLTYNQLPASYMGMGPDLLRVVSNPFFGVVANPTSTLSGPTVEYRQLLRPYPQYTQVAASRPPTANSIYHAMAVRADRRFAKGFSFLLAYTAGKLIDDASHAVGFLGPIAGTKLDAYNLRLERSVSSMDIAQRVVLSYVCELPFGKGRRFFAGAPSVVNRFIAGWQFNGITSFQSGPPLIIFAPVNNTQIFTISQRPNNNGRSARITGGTTGERVARWFDTSVFSQPPSYTFGNTSRTLPNVRNPGGRLTDLSVFKNTFLGPGERVTMQFRVEMFNFFNTPQFSGPGTTVNTGSMGVISAAGAARQIQMAIKLIW